MFNVAAASNATKSTQTLTISAMASGATVPATTSTGLYVSQNVSSSLVGAYPVQVAPMGQSNFNLQIDVGSSPATVFFDACYPDVLAATCTSAGTTSAGPNPFIISGQSYTFTSPGSYSFQIQAPAAPDAVPSSATGPGILGSYQIGYSVESGGDVINDNVPVYVTAPPATDISLNLNLGAIDVYAYNDPLSNSAYTRFPNCISAGANLNPTARQCMQYALSLYHRQGVTGVTLMVPFCTSEFGSGIISGCHSSPNHLNDSPSIDPDWINHFDSILEDLAASGITKLALRPNLQTGQVNYEGFQTSFVGTDGCSDAKRNVVLAYDPTLPFAMLATGGTTGVYNLNGGYSCAGLWNNTNFVGWPLIFQAFNLIFQAMSTNQPNAIQLDAVDLLGEAMISSGETIVMQMVYDQNPNHQFTAASAMQAGFTVSPTSDCPNVTVVNPYGPATDVLGWLNCIAAKNNLDVGVITMSTPDRRPRENAVSVQSSTGYDCTNAYGDSARVTDMSMLVNAFRGNPAGSPSGTNSQNYLICGGIQPSLPSILPFSYPPANRLRPARLSVRGGRQYSAPLRWGS